VAVVKTATKLYEDGCLLGDRLMMEAAKTYETLVNSSPHLLH
jgi:hypothetical protein